MKVYEITTFEDLSEIVESIFYDYFPESLINTRKGSLGGNDTMFIHFSLGKGKSEYNNGIDQNDPMYHILEIDRCLSDMPVLDIVQGGTLMIKPEPGSHYAFGRVKVPFRKTTGNIDKVLAAFDKYLSKLYDTVVANVENFVDVPFDVEDKI